MHTLYAYPNTYALGAHALLEELGLDYNLVDPTIAPGKTDHDFLQASPHGRVPALVLPDQTTVCESGAIVLYLADTYGEQRYTVNPQHPQRAVYLQWLFYLSSTLQPDVMLQFHPEHYFSDDTTQQSLQAAALARLDTIWPILNNQYHTGSWMFDDRPTAVDYALSTVLVWPECFRKGLVSYPHLNAMLDALKQREAFNRALRWHQHEAERVTS